MQVYFIGNKELYYSSLYEHSTIAKCLEWLNNIPFVSLDTETEGFFNHKNKIVMLQLYYGGVAYVIDVRTTSILPLKERLEEMLILGQNLKFDYKFCKFHGIELNNIYDTFIVECCLTNGKEGRQLGLGALVQKYCGVEIDKSIRGQFIGLNGLPFTEQQIVYGVNDVTYLEQIRELQLKEVERLDIIGWVNNELESCLPLADIEYNGMGFDQAKWLELASKAEKNVVDYIDNLDKFVKVDPKLNKFVKKRIQGNLFFGIEEGYENEREIAILWSSPTQVDKVFKALGLDLESTNERFLSKYQNDYPIIKAFIDYKKQQKLVTTYGEEFLKYVNPHTKRVHTGFWQILETSRVSSGSKNDNTPNMQNIPAKIEYRNCFIPREGFKMVSCDFSGQELRLTADGSQEPLWVDAFLNGEDLHSKVASMVFNVPLEDVRNKPDFLRGKSYRDAAKTVNFGLVYGMSKYKLADTLSISVETADTIIKDYFKATSKLNDFLSKCRRYGISKGYIRSFKPYSIIRYFPGWNAETITDRENFKLRGEIERASMNTPIQASGGQMTKRALVLLRNYIREHQLQDKVYIVMTVHDQIDCEVESSFAEEWSLIQKKIMESAGNELIKSIPALSEITISECWTK